MNNRTLKFRFWDSVDKSMHCVDILHIATNRITLFDEKTGAEREYILSETPIMQYTGLKDKHGQDIYEGDIVKFNYKSNEHGDVEEVRGAIMWDTETGSWGVGKDTVWHLFSDYGVYADRTEIIGNIFEKDIK